MSAKKELKGRRFGKLLVTEECGRIGKNVAWKCKCDCGKEIIVKANSLLTGNTTSCGCGRIEAITKHNQTNTPLFNVWRNMKERCTNKNYRTFADYGGRGIKLCEEWQEFTSFYDWAMANGYKKGLSIDRIDVNGDYEPNNCRWADAKTQARNRRNTIFIDYEGVRKSISDWADELKVARNTLYWRYSQGWSTQEILFGRA